MSYAHKPYKRTVRCRHCHQSGHNKSTCPDYAAQIERQRAAHGSDYWMVADYDRKKAKRRNGAERKCSYCDEKGHNRATCSVLKEHMAITQQKNNAFRALVIARLEALGFGLGSLVTAQRWKVPTVREDVEGKPEYHYPAYVVTEIRWDHINIWNNCWNYPDDQNAFYGAKPILDLTCPRTVAGSHLKDQPLMAALVGENRAAFLLDPDYDVSSHYSTYDRDHVDYFLASITSPTHHLDVPENWKNTDLKLIKAVYKGRKAYNGAIGE